MLDGYHIITLTHRQAPLETIGKALANHSDVDAALERIKTRFGWEELLYLATCNRVLYLFYGTEPVEADLPEQMLTALRPDLTLPERAETAARLQLLNGVEAVRHLLEVAASMDSLVVGEREIIRQLRESYEHSKQAGLTGDHIRLLLRFTIETAKEIYTSTGIGQKALSVVALAFGALQKSGLKTDARILMVGAGRTNQLFAKFLKKAGYRRVTVFNRSLENAEALARPNDWHALPLDALEHFSEGFDALIVCTGSTRAVVTPELYQNLIAGASNVKVAVDLSIPNNIDKRIPAAFPVQFIEVESLREAARENLAHRERECEKAAIVIRQKIYDFRERWHERQVERSFANLPGEVRAAKEKAINQVFEKEFAQLDPAAQGLLRQMMDYMEKKCVAIPMKTAKSIALRHGRNRPAPADAAKH
jgi:glutamyl-tRNA reductase